MKYVWGAIVSICLMFTTGYARDIPERMPKLEVTGLATCKDPSKVRAILNDRIVKKGDIFEVTADGKLGAKIVRTKKNKKTAKGVKSPRVKSTGRFLEIGKITKQGVIVHYWILKKTRYIESRLIPLKRRVKGRYGLYK